MKYLKSFGDIWNGIFLILHFLYYISLNLSIDATEPFEAVLDGRIPERVEIGGKEEVIERVLGKKTAGGLEHNPGRELIFSSPKSVSIMGLVAGDKRVLEAHEKSVSAVLDYYERNMVFARVQRDGVLQHDKTDNMMVLSHLLISSVIYSIRSAKLKICHSIYRQNS